VQRIIQYFLKGLIFLIPIAATVWIFVVAFLQIDSWLGLPFPGLGLLVMLVATTFLGALLSSYFTRRILSGFEGLLDRLPFAKLLHGSMKDLMSAFLGEKKRFDRPALVELFPGSGVRGLGFVTRDSLEGLPAEGSVAVYFPQSYNFAGQMLLVPRAQVTLLDAESSDIMAFVVSAGVTDLKPASPGRQPGRKTAGSLGEHQGS
jgi:uncharacterized membrane protein